jgi:hypothetical protein
MPLISTKGAASAQGFGLFGGGDGPDGTRGIFTISCGGGSLSAVRNKYTYASCISTASGVGSASAGCAQGSAAGNNTRGIFALGSNDSGSLGLNTNFPNIYSPTQIGTINTPIKVLTTNNPYQFQYSVFTKIDFILLLISPVMLSRK